MSKFDQVIEVMKRIESNQSAKATKMSVKGTIVMDGDEIVHNSYSTTPILISKSLSALTESCKNCVRTVNPVDDVEFLRINFEGNDSCKEVMFAPEGDVQLVVIQEHPLRDLRQRSPLEEMRHLKGFRHDQQNYFYPSLDDQEQQPPSEE